MSIEKEGWKRIYGVLSKKEIRVLAESLDLKVGIEVLQEHIRGTI